MRIVRQPTLKTYLLLLAVLSIVLAPLPTFLGMNEANELLKSQTIVRIIGFKSVVMATLANASIVCLPLVLALFVRSRWRVVIACLAVALIDIGIVWTPVGVPKLFSPQPESMPYDIWFSAWIPLSTATMPVRLSLGHDGIANVYGAWGSFVLLAVLPLLGLLYARTCKLREVAATCEPVVDPAC